TSFSSITSTTGVNGIYVVNAVVGANNISVTFNAVTNAAVNNAPTQISYAVLRPAGVTAASGYIVASGHVTTVASTNGAAQNFTVAGILTTDVPLAYFISPNTNTIQVTSSSIGAANTLSIGTSADPSTTHQLMYAVIRKY